MLCLYFIIRIWQIPETSCEIFVFHAAVLLRIQREKAPLCAMPSPLSAPKELLFVGCPFFSFHKINLQTDQSILHQFEGSFTKLWDTPSLVSREIFSFQVNCIPSFSFFLQNPQIYLSLLYRPLPIIQL